MYDHVAFAEDTSNLFKREAAIYEVLGSHPCILKCIGVELMPDREEAWALRLERVPHGNLREYIGKNEPPTMTRRLQVAVDFTEALQYVHDRGVIWDDVSPRNVLVFDGLHIKLCDFAGSILKDKFPELLFTCEPRY
ncbi:Serine/threonine-protein kinase HT1 [Fusarium oxysporum f. sp. rapae]|uniref:Serine/threonine-protein kinase HT1 n=1 Tax=Fusarium oxysporum f. sp. rapae TaxID=485398 RepID=A0A8J5P9D0_FUSOX|nr:Serine/threonine-protein kinase HT1 [Fusarium oxysporum f. sp. rapae]